MVLDPVPKSEFAIPTNTYLKLDFAKKQQEEGLGLHQELAIIVFDYTENSFVQEACV